MTANRHTVNFYTKEGCHLCEVALEIIDLVAEKIDFRFNSIDITKDEELMMKFDLEIPVIEIDKEIVFVHKVDKQKLISILKS